MPKNQKRSVTRTNYREANTKVVEAVKVLSQHMHNVNPETPTETFHGYRVPAGDFVDKYGVKCQLQIHAVRLKSDFIKRNEIEPIINKWAIGFKVRALLTEFIKRVKNW